METPRNIDDRTEEQFNEELLKLRQSRSLLLPVKARASQFAEDLLGLLFPHFSEEVFYSPDEIAGQFTLLRRNLQSILQPLRSQMHGTIEEVAERFFSSVPEIYRKMWEDAETIHRGDPAAESVDEVISAYPGFFAIATYRIAHEFYCMEVPIFPRILAESAHHRTGVDIHPGAKIGKCFFIDHGTGIVVGETTWIGDNVKIYQGVTLGALSVDKALASSKRHPTIEDNVVIYSNATILGGETVIGHDSVIGGNVWLTESVPPYSVVYHKSEVRVRDSRENVTPLDFSI
jgi:serine O-acetyltransferase